MSVRNRRVVLAVWVVFGTTGGLFVACAIDQNGTQLPDASTIPDSGIADVVRDVVLDVPQACKTLDATVCVDAALPSAWTYVAIVGGDLACPGAPTDYTQQSYIANLQLEAGACACGCTTTGSYSCAGTINTGSQTPSCNGVMTTFDAGNDAGCFTTAKTDPNLSVGPLPKPTGSVTCDAGLTGNEGWSASDLTACTPACTADYCGVTTPFSRCILSTTDTTCPAPFVPRAQIGTSASVVVACPSCGCTVNAASCKATVTPYKSPDCTTNALPNIPPDGSCNPLGANAASFLYAPTVPPASCTAVGGSTGAIGFSPSITVCCLP